MFQASALSMNRGLLNDRIKKIARLRQEISECRPQYFRLRQIYADRLRYLRGEVKALVQKIGKDKVCRNCGDYPMLTCAVTADARPFCYVCFNRKIKISSMGNIFT